MQIQILQIAATKDKNLLALEQIYEKRISPFAKLQSTTLKASKSDDPKRAQQEELEQFQAKLNSEATIIALDETGKPATSEEFAKILQKIKDHGPGKVQFLIGGSNGLHPDIRKQAHQILSLSKMTFTHEMVRVFLKEQLYRAFTIIANKRYHK